MTFKIIGWLFKKLIADIPAERQKELWDQFAELLSEVAKASAKGAAEGAVSGNRDR